MPQIVAETSNNVRPPLTLGMHSARPYAWMKFDRCWVSDLEGTGIEDIAILPNMNCLFSALTPRRRSCRIGLPVGGFFP